jgi:hypothetical protein
LSTLGVSVFSRPLAIGISVLVSVVWAANLVVGALYPDRHDATINAIFAIIVGAVFGLTPKRETLAAARRRLTRASGDEPEQPPAEDEPADETNTSRGDDS